MEVCRFTSVLSELLLNVLSREDFTRIETGDNPWAAIVFGNRNTGTSAIWTSIRTVPWKASIAKFVPVLENRSAQYSRIISRHLGSASCRRSNANSGASEHKISVFGEIKSKIMCAMKMR